MKKNRDQLKIGIVLNYVNMILGNLIPIAYTPVMLNMLGQSEYGLYKLAGSITSYLSLMSLGISSAVTRYLIKSRTEKGKEEEQRILGLFSLIFKIIGILTFIVGSILVTCLGIFYNDSLTADELRRMKIIVFMMVCNTAFTFSVSPYNSVVNSHEKFVFIQITNIISTCIGPCLNLVMLYLGYSSIGLTISSLILSFVLNFSYIFYVRKSLDIKPIYKNMPTNLLKEILTFSFWVFLSNVISQLYNTTDTVLIGAIPTLATTGVAVYNIGSVFNNIVSSLTMGVSNLLTPKINKLVFSNVSNMELNELAIRVGRIQSYIITLLVSGFIAFGQPFIKLYAGEGFDDSYFVAIFMMIPNIIPMIQSVYLNILVAKNMHKFRSQVYLLIAIINIIGTWILLKYMGVIGAALMTGIALTIGQGFIMNFYYYKKVKLDIKLFWKQVLKVFIIPTFMCIITLFISEVVDFSNIIIMICGIIIYTIIFALLNWLFVMNNYEKEFIKKPINAILKRLRR